MAIAMGQSTQKDQTANTTISLAYGSAVTAGSLLVLAFRLGSGGSAPSAGDSVNGAGSWTLETTKADSAGNVLGLAYFANTGAGTPSVTVNWTGSVTCRLAIMEVTGAATSSPREQYLTANATSTTPASGNVTTTQNDQIVIGFAEVNSNNTWAVGGGYTKVQFVPDSASGKLAVEYLVQTVAGTQNATWGAIASQAWAAGIVTFLAPAAAGGASLKRNSSLSGLGASGPFFHDPLAMQGQFAYSAKSRIFIPARIGRGELLERAA